MLLSREPEAEPELAIPQRLHEYPASDRAKELVESSMTIDTLLSEFAMDGSELGPVAPGNRPLAAVAAIPKMLTGDSAGACRGAEHQQVVRALMGHVVLLNCR